VQATEQVGPSLTLFDAQPLCATPAFATWPDKCGTGGTGGAAAAEMTAREAGLCPSGRLVARDRQNNSDIEPEFPPSIGIVAIRLRAWPVRSGCAAASP